MSNADQRQQLYRERINLRVALAKAEEEGDREEAKRLEAEIRHVSGKIEDLLNVRHK